MSDQPTRPPVRIRFRFNVDTGEIEFIVDDNSPDRSEDYHDKVADAIASYLARHPEIENAGHTRHRLDQEWRQITAAFEERERKREKDTLED